MKLVRYGAPGREKPGIIDGKGRIVEKYVGPLQRSTIAALVERARGEDR